MREDILTPVGRLVMGDCWEAQTKDAEGNPLVTKTGPNAGKPRVAYFIALAVPKTDPGITELLNKITATARLAFPTMFDPQGNCVYPQFAWKIIDGDSTQPNRRGVKPCDKIGFPGNWVLHFTSGFAPKCYSKGGENLLTDPNTIKRGYYIRVYGTVAGNESTQQPGLFLNHQLIELCGYGEEIITGASGEAVFGGTPVGSLPPGASATPLAGTPIGGGMPGPGGGMPGPGGGMPGPGGPGGGMPGPGGPGGGMPGPGGPAYDYLNPQAAYKINGQSYTVDQLKAAGWTEDQIKTLPQ